MRLITVRVLCIGVIGWNLEQPLIQWKDCNCCVTYRTEEYVDKKVSQFLFTRARDKIRAISKNWVFQTIEIDRYIERTGKRMNSLYEKWNHKTWPERVEVIFFPPKASELAINARHPKLVQRVSYISDFIAGRFYLTTSLLMSLQFLSVILSFECDFVFWAWFRLLSVISSFERDFIFLPRIPTYKSVILSFERDFVFWAWFCHFGVTS